MGRRAAAVSQGEAARLLAEVRVRRRSVVRPRDRGPGTRGRRRGLDDRGLRAPARLPRRDERPHVPRGADRGRRNRRRPLPLPDRGRLVRDAPDREELTQSRAVSQRAAPDRNIAMELVRVTEAGAMAAARWIGRGEKESADQAAVDAMRYVLDSVSMRGTVVIGEGEKDEAPMLYNGEEVGNGQGPEVDVAVDPLEGTRLTPLGQPNAIAVIAVAERGTMFFPGAAVYMDKIACGPDSIDVVDIDAPARENVERVARAKGKTPPEGDVRVPERARHRGPN